MSLEGLLRELDKTKRDEQEKSLALVREQYDAIIRAKEEEIASLREEIATLRNWLDHSALPAFNPISRREDSMGLIKLNFGEDKPCPDMWNPGERDMIESIQPRKEEPTEHSVPPEPQEDIFSLARESLSLPEPEPQESQALPEPPSPETEPEPAPESVPYEMSDDNLSGDVKIPSPKRVRRSTRKRASKPKTKKKK